MCSSGPWKLTTIVASAIALSGCASVQPREDYERASQAISDATGATTTTQPQAADSRSFDVSPFLRDGLTVDGAVQLCLLNNPGLLAAFYDIGIARADLVQSKLFSNPTLMMSIAFPDAGGLSNIQATFAQNIVDLWQIPVRSNAAAKSLDASILNVAQRAVQLTNETKIAYFQTVAADLTLNISEENASLTRQLLDVAIARQKAGAVGELDVNLARGAAYGADLEVRRARLATRTARRQLGTLLGLTSHIEELKLSGGLPTGGIPPETDAIVAIALASRFDVRSAREVVEASAAKIRLEYLKIFPDLSIGFYDERNESRSLPGRRVLADTARTSIGAGQLTAPEIQSRGQRQQERSQEVTNMLGPAFNLTIPVFDQNQAQIAKARYAYEQSVATLDAVQRGVVQQVRQAVDEVDTANRVVEYFRVKLLPQAQSNLELSSRSYEVGRATVIVLLDAQRVLLSTRRDAVAADRDAAIAVAELERVTARPYATITAAAASSQPQETVDGSGAAAEDSIAVEGAKQ